MCGYFCILFIEYMLNNKTLTDFTNLFRPWNFEKNDEIIKKYFQLFFYKKMTELINLEDQSNYRLSEVSQIKNYFNEEIQYQQSLTNKLSKYLTAFDYSNKILTVVLTVFSGTNIFSNVNNKQLLGLITSVFSLSFFVFWNNYKITTRNKVKEEKT